MIVWVYSYAPKCYSLLVELQKQCKYCSNFYPENAFGVALTTKDKIYRRNKCRNCYRSTKQTLINRYFKWINERKEEKGCKRCGVRNPVVLDFHHKEGEDKLLSVGGVRRAVGFEQIQREVEKCEVVCANCHRILHDEMRKERVK